MSGEISREELFDVFRPSKWKDRGSGRDRNGVESDNSVKSEPSKFLAKFDEPVSRRSFLKKSGELSVMAGVLRLPKWLRRGITGRSPFGGEGQRVESESDVEGLKLSERMMMVDMVPGYDRAGWQERMLGDDYVPDYDFFVDLKSHQDLYHNIEGEKFREGNLKVVKNLLARLLTRQRARHGELMRETGRNLLKNSRVDGGDEEVAILPLQDAIVGYEFGQGELGGWEVEYSTDTSQVLMSTREYLGSHGQTRVAGFSWQAGRTKVEVQLYRPEDVYRNAYIETDWDSGEDLYYPEEPSTFRNGENGLEYLDGDGNVMVPMSEAEFEEYERAEEERRVAEIEAAFRGGDMSRVEGIEPYAVVFVEPYHESNKDDDGKNPYVEEMHDLAKQLPELLVCGAAGNQAGADVESDNRPENMIMVGTLWNRGLLEHGEVVAKGADIYVYKEEFMIGSSSEATNIMSTLGAVLSRKEPGFIPSELKDWMMENLTREDSYYLQDERREGDGIPTKVLDEGLVRAFLEEFASEKEKTKVFGG